MKLRPEPVACLSEGRQLEGRQRDRQGEAARARTSRIEVEDAAYGLDLRTMRMPRTTTAIPAAAGSRSRSLRS